MKLLTNIVYVLYELEIIQQYNTTPGLISSLSFSYCKTYIGTTRTTINTDHKLALFVVVVGSTMAHHKQFMKNKVVLSSVTTCATHTEAWQSRKLIRGRCFLVCHGLTSCETYSAFKFSVLCFVSSMTKR
jgi:hypothetical protein